MDMDVRVEPDGDRTAISTNLPGFRKWFVFHPDHGGSYTSGEAELIDEWQPLIPDPAWEPPPTTE